MKVESGDTKLFDLATMNRKQGGYGLLKVADLGTGGHFLLVAIRNWVKAVKDKRNPLPILVAGFDLAGVGMALKPFDEVMLATATSSTHPFDVRCTTCKEVGDGEKDILSVISFIQANKSKWAFQRLRSWLPESASRLVLPHVKSIGLELSSGDLIIDLKLAFVEDDFPVGDAKEARIIPFPPHLRLQ